MRGRIVRSDGRIVADQSVPQPLMIALIMEMRHVLRDCATQGSLPYEDHLRRAFVVVRKNFAFARYPHLMSLNHVLVGAEPIEYS